MCVLKRIVKYSSLKQSVHEPCANPVLTPPAATPLEPLPRYRTLTYQLKLVSQTNWSWNQYDGA